MYCILFYLVSQEQMVKFVAISTGMNNCIIWYPGGTSYENFWIEYRLSQYFDSTFFNHSERSTSQIPPVVSAYDQRKKIALIQHESLRFPTTQSCDPSILLPDVTLFDYDLVIVYTAESIDMDWTSYCQAVETQLHTDRIIYMVGGHVESVNPNPDICYVQHRFVPRGQTLPDVFDQLIQQKTHVIDKLNKISHFIYNHKFLSDQYALHTDKSFYYTDDHGVWNNPQHIKNTEYFVWDPHGWWEFRYALKKGKEFFPNAEICNDWPGPMGLPPMPDDLKKDPRKKIALLFLELIHLPWTKPNKLQDPTQHVIADLYMGWADLVIVYTTETLQNWWPVVYGEICKQLHTDRIVLCTAGNVSYSQPHPDLVFVNHQSLLSYVAAGNEFVDINEVTVPFRKSMFDCLMGTVKLSRIALFYRLLDGNFLDYPTHTLVNLQPNPHGDLDWDMVRDCMPDSFARHGIVTDFVSPKLFELEEDVIKEFKTKTQQGSAQERYSTNMVSRPGRDLPCDAILMSCVVPWKVYQSSWYSIVCETNDTITTSQYITEKLGKCLFAKRIFIVIGSSNILSYLRSLGFKTFHGDVIDETYDSEPDWQRRLDMAWQQIERLRLTEPRAAYAHFRDVLEHNHKLMLEWPDKQFEEILQFLQKKLVQI